MKYVGSTTTRLQESVEDGRTLREYLADVEKTEDLHLYPEFSRVRRTILLYWSNAIKQRKVSLDDHMPTAIRKMKKRK